MMKTESRGLARPALVTTALLLSSAYQSAGAQQIVAHRGASADAPENTLAAFQLAWEQGADLIEGDFYLTADRQIVAHHDKDTKRTANVSLPVAQSTLARLRQLDVGVWKEQRFRGQRIPTLQEVLETVPQEKSILIEIKCGPEIVPHLKKVLAASSLAPAQTTVIAFQESVVAAVKTQIPGVKAYWLTGYEEDKTTGRWSPSLPEILATLRRCQADGLDTQANRYVVDQSFVNAIRNAGYELHAWTIDDAEVARHFQKMGVDSITTNRPQLIREALRLE